MDPHAIQLAYRVSPMRCRRPYFQPPMQKACPRCVMAQSRVLFQKSLFLKPVPHPIKRIDHVEGVVGLLDFLAQALDVTVNCAIIDINLIIISDIHQGIAALDYAGTGGECLQK